MAVFAAGDLETVEVITAPQRDPFGDPLPGTATTRVVAGCLFAPGATAEMLTGAQQVEADGTVYLPAGTEVGPADQLRVRGELFDVRGAPRRWGAAGVEVVVTRVTG